jgi:hypothetical protein
MKKEYLLAFSAFFMLSFTTVAITYAGDQSAPASNIIKTYKEDLNANGTKDKIVLKGLPIQQAQSHYKKIRSEIFLSNHSVIKIPYGPNPGFEPKIEFVDLNHDGKKELLESSATGGSGGNYNYHLDTLEDDKAVSIPLPTPLNIQGQFENNFKAMISIHETRETIHLDVVSRKNDYIRTGLYQNKGKLNEATELMIDPVALYKVVYVKGKKGYGLQSFRQISGTYHADALGTVEATWYFENGKWNLIKTKWKNR